MKSNLKLIAIFLLSLTLFNCGGDDDEPNADSYTSFVTYNNVTKELTKAYVTIEDYYVTVVLFSDGIDIDFQNGGTQGAGATIYLDFVSEGASALLAGNYNTDDSLNHFIDTPLFFSDSSVSPSVGFYSDEGSAIVTSGGYGNMTFTFDIIDDQGQHVVGKWTGDLIISE